MSQNKVTMRQKSNMIREHTYAVNYPTKYHVPKGHDPTTPHLKKMVPSFPESSITTEEVIFFTQGHFRGLFFHATVLNGRTDGSIHRSPLLIASSSVTTAGAGVKFAVGGVVEHCSYFLRGQQEICKLEIASEINLTYQLTVDLRSSTVPQAISINVVLEVSNFI